MRRDVRTGRKVPRSGLDRRGYRLGETFFEVTQYPVKDEQEVELCLHHIVKGDRGGGSATALWPCLRVASEEEADRLSKDFVAFARTLSPDQSAGPLTQALERWAGENNFTRRNRSTWARSTAT